MKALVAGFATFFVVYLLGAFVAVDFNVANWDLQGRFLVASIGACAACCAGSIAHD